MARSYKERIGELRDIPACQPCRSELAREQKVGRITRQRYPPVARLADNLFQVIRPTKLREMGIAGAMGRLTGAPKPSQRNGA
ncbi:MAG: hypothetical protein QM805_20240 [Pseudomonas sp.]